MMNAPMKDGIHINVPLKLHKYCRMNMPKYKANRVASKNEVSLQFIIMVFDTLINDYVVNFKTEEAFIGIGKPNRLTIHS